MLLQNSTGFLYGGIAHGIARNCDQGAINSEDWLSMRLPFRGASQGRHEPQIEMVGPRQFQPMGFQK
jgi:hypothetical protein